MVLVQIPSFAVQALGQFAEVTPLGASLHFHALHLAVILF
jgi:hypothetical protein